MESERGPSGHEIEEERKKDIVMESIKYSSRVRLVRGVSLSRCSNSSSKSIDSTEIKSPLP